MRVPILVLISFSAIVVLIASFWNEIWSLRANDQLWGLYNKTFLEGVLGNAHGSVIDLLIVSVVLFWFDRQRSERERIVDLQEDLADLRCYRGQDAAYKTLGIIRRLAAKGVTKGLQLSESFLCNLDIRGLELMDCNLHAAVLTNSRLRDISLTNCNCDAMILVGATLKGLSFKNCRFKRAKFQDATLMGADFSSCDLQAADFTNANLRSAQFNGVDCQGITFKNADLRSADFRGAKNLTVQALQAAGSIRFLKSEDPAIQALVNAST